MTSEVPMSRNTDPDALWQKGLWGHKESVYFLCHMKDMGDKGSHCPTTQASVAFPVLALNTGVPRNMDAVALIIPQLSFTPQQQFRNVPKGAMPSEEDPRSLSGSATCPIGCIGAWRVTGEVPLRFEE